MNKSKNNFLTSFSVIFLAVCAALTVYGTFNDLAVSSFLFSPQSKFAIGFEAFGQCVLWLMWGPLFSVLFLTRHTLAKYTEIFSHFLPFIKPIKNETTKAYKTLNMILRIFTGILFFVLCVIGWKKPIQNILKHIFDISEIVYIVISVVVAAISILLFSKIDRNKLYKLEALAAAGLLLGICLRLTEKFKTVTHRIRFREMVAYSNGFLGENGMSHGSFSKLSPSLQSDMAKNADFSAFTRWYTIGDDMGKYSKADSFPSGHVMNSSAVFLSYLFFISNEKLKKAAPALLVFSSVYVSLMAIARIAAGAHYLTDVTFGLMIGYCVFLLSYKFYALIVKKENL